MDPIRSVFPDLELTPELLVKQGRSLRSLARRLLGDAHEAEDVVQDTWVAYLRQSHSIRGRLSNWLGRVARNRALQRQRGAARQRGREHDTARAEGLEADQDSLLAREETVRAVTRALLELDEPYRVVLLLRFYEDRSPIAIARELGLPPTTVKGRIERGLERLRARLCAQNGNDERWLSGLAFLAGQSRGAALTGPISLGIGALFMGSKLTLVAAAAVVACGLALFWQERAPSNLPALAARTPSQAPRSESLAAAGPALALGPAAQGAAREPVLEHSEPDRITASSGHASVAGFEQQLLVSVRDRHDLPLVGATVHLGFHGQALQEAGRTNADGTLALRFSTRFPRADLLLEARGGGDTTGLREVTLLSGNETLVDVGLPTNENVVLVQTELILEARILNRAGVRITSHLPPSDERFVFRESPPDPHCLRAEYLIESDSSMLAIPLLQFFQASRRNGERTVVLESLLQPDCPPQEALPGAASVRGVVRDAHGDPVPDAVLALRGEEGSFRWKATSDSEGAFDLVGLPVDRPFGIRVGGGDLGLAQQEFQLRAGEGVAWDPLLQRGDEVSGRLVDGEGKPLAGVRLELERVGLGILWTDVTVTRADGLFAFPNVDAGSHDLVILFGENSGVPCKTVRRVTAGEDLGAIVLAQRELERGSLALVLTGPEAQPASESTLRLWHEDSGRGVEVHGADDEGRLVSEGLVAGRYAVEAVTCLGERDLGTFWIEPGETLELGEEHLGPAGMLVLRSASPSEGPVLSLRRLHPSVVVDVAEILAPSALPLRPGSYLLESSGGSILAEFDVLSGVATAFELRKGPDGTELVPTEAPPFTAQPLDCVSCHTQ